MHQVWKCKVTVSHRLNRIHVYIPRKLLWTNLGQKTPDLRKNCSTDGICQIRMGFSLTSDGNRKREDRVPSDSIWKSGWLFERRNGIHQDQTWQNIQIRQDCKMMHLLKLSSEEGNLYITVKIEDDHWLFIVRDICPCNLTLTQDWLWFGGFLNSCFLRCGKVGSKGLNAETQSTSPQIQIWNHCALLEETYQIQKKRTERPNTTWIGLEQEIAIKQIWTYVNLHVCMPN